MSKSHTIFFNSFTILSLVGLALAGVMWYVWLVPELLEIDDSFSYTAEVKSFDNFYDPDTESFLGEQESKTTYYFEYVTAVGDHTIIKNVFDVKTLDDEEIFSVERLYGVHSETGKHNPSYGDRVREGYLFAPRMKSFFAQAKDKSSYVYWHVNYDAPLEMVYETQEHLFGLLVYKYHTNFIVDQSRELADLPGVGGSIGIQLEGSLDVWIEPYTGRMVKYQDDATAYYYDIQTGERKQPWNTFHNSFSERSVGEQIYIISILKQKIIFLNYGFIFLILLLVALILFKSNRRMKKIANPMSNNQISMKRFVLPGIVLIVVMVMTGVLSYFTYTFIKQSRQIEFEAEATRISDAITDRLEIYTSALYAGRGLMKASDSVTREEWHEYVDALQIQKNYPGIQGFGYSVWLRPDELDTHIALVRSQGFENYTVYPAGKRDQYTSIVYIEPFDARNQEAFGFDMYQEPVRKNSMEHARDSGGVAMSGRVTLVQEIDDDVQAGFLLYVPVYIKGADISTVVGRREALVGFVYSPFRAQDFIAGTLPEGTHRIHFAIYDGDAKSDATHEHLILTTAKENEEVFFESYKTIDFGGNTWILYFTAPSDYASDFLRMTAPFMALVGGTFVAISLFFILFTLRTRQEQAENIARSITKDLSKKNDENMHMRSKLEKTNQDLEKSMQQLANKIAEIETINKHMVGRELRLTELKKEIEILKKNNTTSN